VLREYDIITDLASTEQDLDDVEAYSRTGGVFLVLEDGCEVIGTVALLRQTDSTCELCRMYLAPGHRGRGLGRLLLDTALQYAAQRGFTEIRLETAAVLREAIALYRSAGFAPIDANPLGKNCNLTMSKRLD
jgi:GNAT superfamily N-acetyltransferase